MTKENSKTSHTDVFPAVATFLNQVNFDGNLHDLPLEMQEITELLLETEQANELHVREKMLRCLNIIRQFSKTMEPFSSQQIEKACNIHSHV